MEEEEDRKEEDRERERSLEIQVFKIFDTWIRFSVRVRMPLGTG